MNEAFAIDLSVWLVVCREVPQLKDIVASKMNIPDSNGMTYE